jgi:tetratricopeptide (TPR) repeat protein
VIWTLTLVAALLAQESGEALYQRGLELFRERKLDEAATVLTEAVRQAPSARAWKALGVVFATAQNYVLAEPAFREACRIDSKEQDACYFHARALYALDRYEPSVEALKRASPAERDPARIELGMAQAIEALGRAPEAERRYLQAIKLYKSTLSPDFDPRLHYGIFLFRQARLSDALAQFEKAPESVRLRYYLGRTLYQMNRLEQAARQLERAVQLDPADATSALLLSKVHAQLSAQGSVRSK